MDVNGCHIVNTLCADSPDGFAATVTRFVGYRTLTPWPPEDAAKVVKGPFLEQVAAVKYAMSWNDAANPPQMPGETAAPPIEQVPTPPADPSTEKQPS